MQGIGSFFDKFKNKAVEEIQKRIIISDILSSVLKTRIEPESLDIKNGVITLKGSHLFKNEIFIKKTMLLESLKKQLPNVRIVDIR